MPIYTVTEAMSNRSIIAEAASVHDIKMHFARQGRSVRVTETAHPSERLRAALRQSMPNASEKAIEAGVAGRTPVQRPLYIPPAAPLPATTSRTSNTETRGTTRRTIDAAMRREIDDTYIAARRPEVRSLREIREAR